MRILPLGGLGEVGMNCLALEEDGDVVIVDCGVTFDDRGLGVDVVYPDLRALSEYRVRGLVLTHGHEDHIGAVHHLLSTVDAPVYATRYVVELLRKKAEEHEVLHHANIQLMSPRAPFSLGPFEVEAMRVTHSAVDAVALSIRMRRAHVVHTGDFKIDPSPPDGLLFDEERFSDLGKEGVSLLLSDSTNSEVPGNAGSEASVREALERVVAAAPARVVVGLFASNVHRLKVLVDVAQATNRHLVLLGRSLATHGGIASRLGWVSWPSGLVVSAERAASLPKDKVLALATGTQGESHAALALLARGEHPWLTLEEGDSVFLSARVIPGREIEVSTLLAQFLRRGIAVETGRTVPGLHVSGHACREEQRRMIDLTRPTAFLPVHGALQHLTAHARLAREMGIGQIALIENGEVARLEDGVLAREGTCLAGTILTMSKIQIPHGVIGERRALAMTGFANVIVRIDAEDNLLAMELVDRGVMTTAARHVLLERLEEAVRKAWAETPRPQTLASRCEQVRIVARRALSAVGGQKPITVVTPIRMTTAI